MKCTREVILTLQFFLNDDIQSVHTVSLSSCCRCTTGTVTKAYTHSQTSCVLYDIRSAWAPKVVHLLLITSTWGCTELWWATVGYTGLEWAVVLFTKLWEVTGSCICHLSWPITACSILATALLVVAHSDLAFMTAKCCQDWCYYHMYTSLFPVHVYIVKACN